MSKSQGKSIAELGTQLWLLSSPTCRSVNPFLPHKHTAEQPDLPRTYTANKEHFSDTSAPEFTLFDSQNITINVPEQNAATSQAELVSYRK